MYSNFIFINCVAKLHFDLGFFILQPFIIAFGLLAKLNFDLGFFILLPFHLAVGLLMNLHFQFLIDLCIFNLLPLYFVIDFAEHHYLLL
jgi:hypothetical protein